MVPCQASWLAAGPVEAGAIGEVIEVHYYDGNRGPLWHTADKIETAPTAERKAASWFYSQAKGGGSLPMRVHFSGILRWFDERGENNGLIGYPTTSDIADDASAEVTV